MHGHKVALTILLMESRERLVLAVVDIVIEMKLMRMGRVFIQVQHSVAICIFFLCELYSQVVGADIEGLDPETTGVAINNASRLLDCQVVCDRCEWIIFVEAAATFENVRRHQKDVEAEVKESHRRDLLV